MTPNPFYIDYLVTKTSASQFLIGTRSLLVAEARVMNPEANKYNRADARHGTGFESTMLRQWQEIQITVRGIVNGLRDTSDVNNLSKRQDYDQFFQSAANGQRMILDASNIGGLSDLIYVKLTSTTNELRRQRTKQKYDVSFRLEVVA